MPGKGAGRKNVLFAYMYLNLCMRMVMPTGRPFCGVGFNLTWSGFVCPNLGHVDLIAVEYLRLRLHRVVVNLLLGSWAFVVYLGCGMTLCFLSRLVWL